MCLKNTARRVQPEHEHAWMLDGRRCSHFDPAPTDHPSPLSTTLCDWRRRQERQDWQDERQDERRQDEMPFDEMPFAQAAFGWIQHFVSTCQSTMLAQDTPLPLLRHTVAARTLCKGATVAKVRTESGEKTSQPVKRPGSRHRRRTKKRKALLTDGTVTAVTQVRKP